MSERRARGKGRLQTIIDRSGRDARFESRINSEPAKATALKAIAEAGFKSQDAESVRQELAAPAAWYHIGQESADARPRPSQARSDLVALEKRAGALHESLSKLAPGLRQSLKSAPGRPVVPAFDLVRLTRDVNDLAMRAEIVRQSIPPDRTGRRADSELSDLCAQYTRVWVKYFPNVPGVSYSGGTRSSNERYRGPLLDLVGKLCKLEQISMTSTFVLGRALMGTRTARKQR